MIGRILSVEIHRPGRAEQIAENGWTCSYPECKAKPTVEVRFTRAARGVPGYTVGSHGTCEQHAEDHARALHGDAVEADGGLV